MTESDAHSTVEKLWKHSLNYSSQSNDALVTPLTKALETIAIVLSHSSDNERIERSIDSLDYERKVALKFEKKGFDVLRQLSFDLIESLEILLQVKGKKNEEQKQILFDEAPNSTMTIVVPKAEPTNPIDQILEGSQLPMVDDVLGESLFKEEEMDFNFEDNNATIQMDQSLNEFPSNDNDSHGNIVHSDVMGDDMNCMVDPIIQDHNSTLIEMDSLVENMDDSVKTEMSRKEKGSMEETEEEKDKTVQNTTTTRKDGVKKKMGHSRTSSRPMNYTESVDESEPLVKKPKIKSEKKIDHKRGSVIDEALSNASTKGLLVTKVNHVELECPNCEYRSLSVPGWRFHIATVHYTTPRQMNLALLCECGHESFTEHHSRECDISKITIVRKKQTPKCVMCEIFPKTACGYARHLIDRHKTTLKQKGIFLTCSCGHEVRTQNAYLGHIKECNGHEYTLHSE